MLPEANTQRQGEISTDKSIAGLHPKLLLHLDNSVPALYKTGNMQSAILLSFVASPSYHHVGFNLFTCGCPIISVHT